MLKFNISAQVKLADTTKVNTLKEVIISAQYAPTSEKNAVYKVQIINHKAIEAKVATDLTQLLRQELNLDFSFHSALGAGIELNGVSKENIKILVDGVPLIGRVNGILNLNQINLDNIERIEMIEGPVSVFYGTNAMGGTINLITKKSQTKAVEGAFSGYYETTNLKRIDANIGLQDGKNLFKFNAGYSYFNGLNTDDNLLRTLNWPTNRKYNKNFKYIRDFGKLKLRFSSDYSNELVKTLGKVRGGKATDIDYTTKRFDNSLNLSGKLKNGNYIDVTTSYLNYDRYDKSYKYKVADGTSTFIENNPFANANYFDTFFAKGQYANSKNTNKLNYVLGFEYENNDAEGNRIFNRNQTIKNTSFFGSINYKWHNLELQPALRFTNNTSFDNLWSPAFNAKYRINDNSQLRLGYAKGFRAPSIKELYLDFTPSFYTPMGLKTVMLRGNKELKLESSNSFNLYYSYRKVLSITSFIRIEPSVMYNEIKDLIGLSEEKIVGSPLDFTTERHYINLNKVRLINPSLLVKYTMDDNLNTSLGFSYLGRYLEYSNEFNSGNFMFSPALNASVNYTVKPLDLGMHLFYKYTGKRKGHFIDDSSGSDVLTETIRQDFSNLDISLSKNFLNKKIFLSIGAKNIFNVTDIETVNQISDSHDRNIQLWGSSYFVKTTIKL